MSSAILSVDGDADAPVAARFLQWLVQVQVSLSDC